MAKVRDLGMNIAPRRAAGKHEGCENSGTACAANDATCFDGDGDDDDDNEGCAGTSGTACAANEATCIDHRKKKKADGYQAFSHEAVAQLRQQLEAHLGA